MYFVLRYTLLIVHPLNDGTVSGAGGISSSGFDCSVVCSSFSPFLLACANSVRGSF